MKRKVLRFVLKTSLLIILFFQMLIGIGFRILDGGVSAQTVKKLFKDKVAPTFHDYDFEGRNIHYAVIGADTLPPVLLVHGSPGSWEAYMNYFLDSVLVQRTCLIAVDRPGFGKSGKGQAEISLEKQAAALVPVLKKHWQNEPAILVGHSYGGPVIARLAMDYPELVKSLIIVAGSISPEAEKHMWYNYLAEFPPVKVILPKSFKASNTEIWHLKPELEAMLPLWEKITIPVTVLQGTEDNLVSPENADFAEKMLVNSNPLDIQQLQGMGHLILFTKPQLIINEIYKHLEY